MVPKAAASTLPLILAASFKASRHPASSSLFYVVAFPQQNKPWRVACVGATEQHSSSEHSVMQPQLLLRDD